MPQTPQDDTPTPRNHAPEARVALPGGQRVRESALSFAFVASSGPGGQNVNKRATKAQLRVRIGELGLPEAVALRLRAGLGGAITESDEWVISADGSRSQPRNREACLARLADEIRRAKTVPKARKKTRPSRGANQRRIDEKKQRGETKRRRRERFD